MNDYLIELHHVSYEITMYVEELKMYGNIKHYNDRFPLWVWIESSWEQDILGKIYGVKKVRVPMYRHPDSKIRDKLIGRGNY